MGRVRFDAVDSCAKGRGPGTGWGDYYVRYTLFLSKSLKPRPLTIDIKTNEVTSWEPPSQWPDLDRLDWSTYSGGGYDGLEELFFGLEATCPEVAIGGLWMSGRIVAPRASLCSR